MDFMTFTLLIFLVAVVSTQNFNITNTDALARLTPLLDSNRTVNEQDLALLNRTADKLGLDRDLIAKFVANRTERASQRNPAYNEYEGDTKDTQVRVIGESPDYASSVVLASDLLSLTSAIASLKDNACRDHGYKFLDGLLLNKRWALKMFDASAKSPQGLLFGSSYHLGNFDECVGIEDSNDNGVSVDGQYCLATIKWQHEENKIRTGRGETLRWAVCVPNVCNSEAVQSFVSSVLSHTVGNNTGVEVSERDCYTRRPLSINNLDVAFLSLILVFMTILTLSTIFEIFIIYMGKKKDSVITELITSFSVINNVKKIISTKQQGNLGLECVTGIKALSMIFILGGHACLFIASGPVMDATAWDRLIRTPLNGFMLNNALLVDTFLFLSAFLFCRLLLIELDKRRGKLNVIPILVFRYIRVTPAYAVIILFYMTWFPKIGEGPLWDDRLLLERERCMESWWANILYINNYVNTDQMCMFQSWYLSVDTQLFFVAPIFIYSLWRWRKFGTFLLSFAILVSMLVPSVITYKDKLDPTLLFFAKEFTDIVSNFYFKEAYIKTHMKMITYCMGLLTGYVLHRIQSTNYQMSYLLKSFAWLISIILGTVTTFSVTLFYQEWYEYSNIEAAAYISLHKLAWGIANGWLIIACSTGNGGILGRLLSWKFLGPVARLTFCAYLVNGIVELYYVGQLRHPMHITFFTVVASATSHIVLTFFLALLLCLTFESPLHGIEKILLKRFAQPKHRENPNSVQTSRNTSQSRLES
ncbi:nose resistant to fluoxetine protein 6-like [Bombyx mandarina]|uniref:Nose resistant to fluoxetine protein 6-like n=1 Tax=Bombyx mandarina TaxID=7092 RepID=A0A6J2JHV8_BOMMA|nr:nose resistant to fluoxetine protein 6-like [Bombyx mandarina]